MRGKRALGYKLATKILKTQRKIIFLENIMTENPENTLSVTQGSPNLIREEEKWDYKGTSDKPK